jgi:hypothetical protein
MMPNAPGDLMSGGLGPGGIGGTPPGGGAPPAGPITPGPAGSVPEVSNERRPGLTYNTHTAKTDLNEGDWWTVAEKLVSDHEFSPNWVGREIRARLMKEGATTEQAEDVVAKWLSYILTGNDDDSTVPEIDTVEEPATLPENEVELEPEASVDEWELPQGLELRDADEEAELPQRITHVGKNRDVRYRVDPKKKYSIVDPEAEPLTGEESESTEQTRQGPDIKSVNSEDQGRRD